MFSDCSFVSYTATSVVCIFIFQDNILWLVPVGFSTKITHNHHEEPWRSNPQSTHVSHRDAGSDSRRKTARMSFIRHNVDRACSYTMREIFQWHNYIEIYFKVRHNNLISLIWIYIWKFLRRENEINSGFELETIRSADIHIS